MLLSQSSNPGTHRLASVTLLLSLTPVLVLTFIYAEAGRLNWLLEVGPALLGFIALALTYRRLSLSNFCYICVFLHTLVLIYGGYYTYAETPLGNWAKEVLPPFPKPL